MMRPRFCRPGRETAVVAGQRAVAAARAGGSPCVAGVRAPSGGSRVLAAGVLLLSVCGALSLAWLAATALGVSPLGRSDGVARSCSSA